MQAAARRERDLGMQLRHLGHATLVLETERVRVLVDPGVLSDGWHDLQDLDVVAVTHQHADHLDTDHIDDLLAANPGATLLADPGGAAVVADLGLTATAVAPGDAHTFGDVTITGVGGTHAQIHPSIARIDNVGYVVEQDAGPRVLHPGDALDAAPDDVDVLALPIGAPWARVAQIADFAAAIGAASVVPIHDGVLSPAGRDIHLRLVRTIAEITVADLADGSRLTL